MNNIFKSALAGAFLVAVGSLPLGVHAQQSANVSLSGNLTGNAGANNYTGFPINSLYHLQFANQGIAVSQNVVRIQLVLPPAIEFMPTYPGVPAGWTYVRVDAQTATLENTTDALEVLPATGSIVMFDVPIKTVASSNGQTQFGWGVGVSLGGAFANWSVPSNAGNQGSGFTTVLNSSPLNIQFIDFTAKADANCSVDLAWKTVAEKNTEKFLIERSADGTTFASVGEVKAATTTQEVNEYSFVDRRPVNGHNLYRIRQVAVGGKSTTSNVESVKMACSVDEISIYPNPTEGIVYIKGLTDKGTVRIFNALGQLVLEKEVQNTVEGINMNALANGFYQVHVMKGEESVFSTKLIKK